MEVATVNEMVQARLHVNSIRVVIFRWEKHTKDCPLITVKKLEDMGLYVVVVEIL